MHIQDVSKMHGTATGMSSYVDNKIVYISTDRSQTAVTKICLSKIAE
jgi:hypothetical protein